MSFTFAHIADIHIGNYPGKIETGGVNARFLDFVSTYNESIDRMIADKVELCLIPGDIFRTKNPGPDELDAFTDGIIKLVKQDIPVVIVLGNHDIALSDRRSHSFAALTRLMSYIKSQKHIAEDRFIMSHKPEILKVRVGEQIVQIQTMPYPVRNLLKMKTTHEIEQYMIKTIDELYASRDKSLPIIFGGHFSIRDATIGGEQFNFDKFTEPVIPKTVFEGKAYLYVAMGHLHQYQVIMENPLVVYCGSNNRVDFNEAKEDKGFVEVKVDGNVKHRFIKVNARKFIDLKYDLSEESEPLKKFMSLTTPQIDKIKDAVVRLSVTLSKTNRFKYDDGEVEKFLNEYCYHIHGTTIPNIKVEKDEREIAGFIENMSVFEALRHYAEIKGIDNKEDFIRLGENIVKQVNGGEQDAMPKL